METIKKRAEICLVLTHRQQLRSWVYNGLLMELRKHFNIRILLSPEFSGISGVKEFEGLKVDFWKQPANAKVERIALFLQLVGHRNHRTFRERIRKQIFDEKVFQSKIEVLSYITKSIRRKTLLYGIHLKLIRGHYTKKYQEYLKLNLVQELPNADLYLVVTSMSNITTDALLYSLEFNKKHYIQVVENWDNLSSKLSINFSPDHLVVWSEQTKLHAMDIHNVSPEIIQILGSPRFPSLRKIHELKSLKPITSSNLRLYYAGFYSECNNLQSIVELCEELEKSFSSQEFTLVYRPHPLNRDLICSEYKKAQPRNIVLDLMPEEENNNSNWPTYFDGFYNELLKCDVIIGTPSTFLIEELMFDKPIILDFRTCSAHYNSAKRHFAHSTHLEELANSSEILKMNNLSELHSLLLMAMSMNTQEQDRLKSFLAYNNELDYSERLINFVEDCLGKCIQLRSASISIDN